MMHYRKPSSSSQYFQKEVPVRFDSCPDLLFAAAYSVKYSVKRMKKWEKAYTALKIKEQEDQEEVRVYIVNASTISHSSITICLFLFDLEQRLRTENRMLRQKVSMLETESAELAERLVRGQVSRADQEETAFHLKRDLEAIKQHDAETTAQLRELQERLRHMEEVGRLTLSKLPSPLDQVSSVSSVRSIMACRRKLF